MNFETIKAESAPEQDVRLTSKQAQLVNIINDAVAHPNKVVLVDLENDYSPRGFSTAIKRAANAVNINLSVWHDEGLSVVKYEA